ncbi:DUF4265 domain-containing protein [Thermomonospora echinospora]|uniref:DUF4265 domain-containing protein n=1 Tax=Thermomonospora echinospora TaxID=1992 RepID=UPI0011B02472|nr:DUF4265 domain-containing protein [Thermomonospora echinospora]
MALHDRVRLSDDGRWVTGLVEPSGHHVLRMLWTPTADHTQLAHRIARVKTEIATAGLLSEWRGRHVAIDLPPAVQPQPLLALMAQEVDAGRASWEWADAEPFAG